VRQAFWWNERATSFTREEKGGSLSFSFSSFNQSENMAEKES
jgi:hypothetical protein